MAVDPIPKGHSAVIPYLLVPDGQRELAFLHDAFGAVEVHRTVLPDQIVMHAHVRIRDSSVMLGQAPPGHKIEAAMLYMYVEDVDRAYERALSAGATSKQPPRDEFYGDRVCWIADPAGHSWWLASHKEEISADELTRRAVAARSKKNAG